MRGAQRKPQRAGQRHCPGVEPRRRGKWSGRSTTRPAPSRHARRAHRGIRGAGGRTSRRGFGRTRRARAHRRRQYRDADPGNRPDARSARRQHLCGARSRGGFNSAPCWPGAPPRSGISCRRRRRPRRDARGAGRRNRRRARRARQTRSASRWRTGCPRSKARSAVAASISKTPLAERAKELRELFETRGRSLVANLSLRGGEIAEEMTNVARSCRNPSRAAAWPSCSVSATRRTS